MKGKVIKTRVISILLIIFILSDMLSPYSILLNKNYAVEAQSDDTLGLPIDMYPNGNPIPDGDYFFIRRTSEIKTKDDVRYFSAMIGVTGDYIPSVIDLELKYNTDMLQLVNNVMEEPTEATLSAPKLTRYMLDPSSELVNRERTLTTIYPQEGKILLNVTNMEGYNPSKLEKEGWMDYLDIKYATTEVPEGYNGMLPIAEMLFKIKDPTINEANLTADLFKFHKSPDNDHSNTGLCIVVEGGDNSTNTDDYQIQGLKYVRYDGFVTSSDVKNIQTVELTKEPKKDYEHGQTILGTGGEITITYTDGSTYIIHLDDENEEQLKNISAPKFNTPADIGNPGVEIIYTDPSTKQTYKMSYELQITDPIVSMILEGSSETKTDNYYQDEYIDFTGVKAKLITKSGKINEIIQLSNEELRNDTGKILLEEKQANVNGNDVEIHGEKTEDNTIIATQHVKLTYKENTNITAKWPILVHDSVDHIEVIAPKKSYIYGDKFDWNEGSIKIFTKANKEYTEPLSVAIQSDEQIGFKQYPREEMDGKTEITQHITITYLSKYKDEYDITMTDNITNDIFLKAPIKTVYDPTIDTSIDYAGGYVCLITESGQEDEASKVPLTDSTVTRIEPDLTQAGKEVYVQIKYKGKDKQFPIRITNPVIGIKANIPNITYSYPFTKLNLEGAKVSAVHFDGTTSTAVPITDNMIIYPEDLDGIGTKQVRVKYENKTSDPIDITVNDVIESIKIKEEGEQPFTRYKYNENLKEGGYIEVRYAYDKTRVDDVRITPEMITQPDLTKYDPSKVTFEEGKTTASKTLQINYDGESTPLPITIVNEITGIELVKGEGFKEVYNVKDVIDEESAKNGQIRITRQTGNPELKDLNKDWISGLNSSQEIKGQLLTITYTENDVTKTTQYPIDVVDTVKYIEVVEDSVKYIKSEYDWNEELDVTGGLVKVVKGSKEEIIPMSQCTITGFRGENGIKIEGERELTVSYGGQTAERKIKVEVRDRIDRIEMATMPTTNYELNGTINKQGTVKLIRQSGKDTEIVNLTDPKITITGLDTSTETVTAPRAVTVSYKERETDEAKTTKYNIYVIDRIERLRLDESKNTNLKTIYFYDEVQTVQKTGGKVTLVKKSGAIEDINLADCTVNGYSATEIGKKNLEVVYNRTYIDNSTSETKGSYEIEVKNYVKSIEVTPAGEQKYGYGESLKLEGGIVTLVKANGDRTETLNLNDPKITIVDKDTITQRTGKNIEVKVQYTDTVKNEVREASFFIDVEDKVTSVELVGTIINEYIIGERLDNEPNLNGAYYLKKTLHNQKGEKVYITKDMITGFTTATSTENNPRTMTITPVEGWTEIFEYPYTVRDYVEAISVTTPNKTRYLYPGNTTTKVDISGVIVKKHMKSGAILEIGGLTSTNITYDEYVQNSLGQQEIKVTYKDEERKVETSFNIYVINQLKRITLNENFKPNERYTYGDNEDFTGVKIDVEYLTGTVTETVKPSMVTNFYTVSSEGKDGLTGETTPRTAVITKTFKDPNAEENTSPDEKTVQFNYYVDDAIERIELTEPTNKTYYYGLSEELDLEGGKITIVMKSGASVEKRLKDIKDKISGYTPRPTKLGDQVITVNYDNVEAHKVTFTITVKDRLEGISVTNLPEQTYWVGEEINLENAMLSLDRLKDDNTVNLADAIEEGYVSLDDFSTATPTKTLTETKREATITRIEDGISKEYKFQYEVKDYVESIRLVEDINKKYYLYANENEFKLTGAYLETTMKSGVQGETIYNLDTNSKVTKTPFDSNITSDVGNKRIIVNYTNEKGDIIKAGEIEIQIFDRVEKIELVNGEPDTEYYYGESIRLNGAQLKVTKLSSRNSTPELITVTPAMVQNFYTENTNGNSGLTDSQGRTAKIPYSDSTSSAFLEIPEDKKEITFNYTVKDYVETVKLVENIDREYYLYEDDTNFNASLANAYIEVVMKSGIAGTTINNLGSNENVIITPFDNKITGTVGNKTIKIQYKNEKGTIIDVKDISIKVFDRVEKLELVGGTPQENYKYGDPLQLNGAQLKITKLSGETTIPVTPDMVENFYTINSAGKKGLTGSDGRIAKVPFVNEDEFLKVPEDKKEVTFKYIVEDFGTGIKGINTDDIKGTYDVNTEPDDFDKAYIEVGKASDDDDGIEKIYLDDPRVEVTGYDPEKPGKQEITVTYTNEKDEKFDITFEVIVMDRVESIELIGTPDSEYKYGEEIRLNGAQLKVTKLSGKVETITVTPAMVPDFHTNRGESSLTNGTPREAEVIYTNTDEFLELPESIKMPTFEYEVEDYVIGITLVAPTNVEYDYGTPLEKQLGDSHLVISMASGASAEDVSLKDPKVTLSGYNPKQLGPQTITVSYSEYDGKESDLPTFGVKVVDKVTEVIFDIDSIGAKDYLYGDKLDLTKATALVKHLSPLETTVKIDNSMISGYNSTILGKQTVTVTVEGKTKDVEVNVVDYVTGVTLKEPTKKDYIVKEPLSLEGGKLNITMASHKSTDKPIVIDLTKDNPNVKISGYDPKVLGVQTIDVVYTDPITKKKFEKSFVVNVQDKLAGISIEKMPNTTQYNYGEQLDVAGAKLRITNESDEFKIIDITEDMVSGYNPKVLGTQTITVTYENEKGESSKTTFAVVVNNYVKDIEFTKPDKKEYKWGEELDLTGSKFTEILANGEINKVINVTKDMVDGFNNKVVGKQTLTATYGEEKGIFEVTVKDNIKSIAISKLPNKTEYVQGENIDITGGKITVIKDSGIYEIDITNEMISGYNPDVIGTQIIKVKYEGLETEFAVVVKEKDKENTNNEDNSDKPNKPTKPIKPNNTVPDETQGNQIEDIIGGILNNTTPSEEDTNANASEIKDKENNNDVNKDITLGVQEGNEHNSKEKIMVRTVTASGIGIVALIALVLLFKKKNNVKIYEEDENELFLVGKDKIGKDDRIIDISEYIKASPDHNIVIVLSKNLSKRLDKETIKIKINDNEELETVVEYEDAEFEIRIEK